MITIHLFITILFFNSLSVSAYETIASIATLLGYNDDSLVYSNRAAAQKESLISNMYNAELGAFCDGIYENKSASTHYSYHATAMALACGIYLDQTMANKMATFLSGGLKTSVYYSYFVLEGLYKSGNGDIANSILLNSDLSTTRSWAYMINVLNATLTAEAWSESNKDNMTLSHPWGSAPAYAIKYGIFGINPTKAGYEEFEINIQNGSILNAEILFPTMKGNIKIGFDFSDNHSLSLDVPANTTAIVYLPDYNGEEVLLDGKPAQVENISSRPFIHVGSGTRTISY